MVGTFFLCEGEGRRLSAQVPGPSSIDDLCQFQHIAGGAPAPMTAGSVFRVRADLSGLCHQQIQLALWKLIELLQFQLSVEQVAAKPLASLFLGWDVSVQAASQRGCVILRLCGY